MAFLEPYEILIRVSTDLRLLAPTRRLSQLATPFIGFSAKVSLINSLTESHYFPFEVILGITSLGFGVKRLGRN